MALRRRISLAAAAAAAIALIVSVVACYAVLSSQLHGQIDNELRAQASAIQSDQLSVGAAVPSLSPGRGGASQYAQVVISSSGSWQIACWVNGRLVTRAILPQVATAKAIAVGTQSATMTTVQVDGTQVRMYTFPQVFENQAGARFDGAIQLARPLTSIENVLSTIRLILVFLVLLGVGLAALIGRLAAKRVLAPLADMTATAQLIGDTNDLTRRIEVQQQDEVGQLATSFNGMLGQLAASRSALDASMTSQRQLVADASHELRTPITSLRTNIEVLLEGAVLDEEDRQRLLSDVVEQSEELSTLVSDLIEVARGDLPEEAMEDTRLDRLVEEAIDRARRHNPSVRFESDLQPVALHGHSERLSRAVNNLLDNAAKHNRSGEPVEVTLTTSTLAVRDHGDGIPPDDIPYVFDRFFRGINSRSRQGSGLGLAIVRQVAEQHGGSAVAANAATGGAVFTLRLPGVPVGEYPDSAVADDAAVASDPKPASQ